MNEIFPLNGVPTGTPKLFVLNIGYVWGADLITNCYAYDTLDGAKAEIERLLPGTVWEDQKTYLVVDLHQYTRPVALVMGNHSYHEVFDISISWNDINARTGYRLATKKEQTQHKVSNTGILSKMKGAHK